MSYVKNYNPGKITVDLPTANYIYELSLLSFSDLYGSFGLSLIFNRKMKADASNPYNMVAGYKLNVHKKLIFEDDIPASYQEENGKCVDLFCFGESNGSKVYTFDDDSRRILRPGTSAYTVENADMSKEEYDLDGKITYVYDKYGNVALAYTYDSTGKLVSVVYRGSKTVNFTYDTANQLSQITYANAACSTSLTYVAYGIRVFHYSGVTYNVMLPTATVFNAQATAIEGETTVSWATTATRTATNTMKIANSIDGETVNSVTYEFPYEIENFTDRHSWIEATDHLGVKTRMQYAAGRLMYSYEVTGTDVTWASDKYLGDVQIHRTEDNVLNSQAEGTLTKRSGVPMFPIDGEMTDEWQYDADYYTDADGAVGYYLLTGWIKRISSDDPTIEIHGRTDGQKYYCVPDANLDGKWKFFAYRFWGNTAIIRACFFDYALETKDFRLSFQKTGVIDSEDSSNILMSGSYLVSGDTEIAMEDAEIYCTVNGADQLVEGVTEADIMRYKLRKKRYGSCAEFTYKNGRCAILGVQNVKAMLNGYKEDISIFDVVTKMYFHDKEYLTKTHVDEYGEESAYITVENYQDSTVYASQVVDKYLDAVSSTADDVTTTYTRNANGLITAESVKNAINVILYTRTMAYGTDASGNPVVTATDEFNKETVYTLDPIWGGVKSVKLPDETVVTDTYDDDMCAMTMRTFGSASGRSNSLSYSLGNLSAMQTGTLSYGFTYAADKLSAISKNSAQIEEHVHTDTTTNSYYPSQTSKLHSTLATFDKYGRLASIDGVLTNVHDAKSLFDESGALIATANNGSAYLAMTTDEIQGETARFSYDRGLLTKKTISDAEDFSDKVSEEVFTYDKANRLTKHTATYDVANAQSVESEVSYKKAETDASADNIVETYTYKINGSAKAETTNTFDEYNRLKAKAIWYAAKTLTKTIDYTATRATSVTDKIANVTVGRNEYSYDALGRVLTDAYSSDEADSDFRRYTYDQYGQLIREDNKGLAKTFIYSYNDIGNLASVEEYPYTFLDYPNATPVTTTFGYTNDKLTSFGGATITYNSMGCPTKYNGMNASWSKGRLSTLRSGSLTTGTSIYRFTYNAFGQRVSKTYSFTEGTTGQNAPTTGQVTAYSKKYFYDHAGRLIAESTTQTRHNASTGIEKIVFLYDESGMIGIQYTAGLTTNVYCFQRNLQGDVVALYDTNGTMVAKYLYDAWGNCTISPETTNTAVANANPIRYRGYYYDSDTGLYYCNARYYSPLWRRFISPDDTAYLDAKSVNGLNLYCYCNNDPVNFVDPSGCAMVSFLIGLGIAALIGAGMGAASYAVGQSVDSVLTGDFEWSWGGFLGAAVGGAVGGALAYTIGGIVVTSKVAAFGIKMAGAFLSGAATNAGTMIGENISGDVAYSAEDIAVQSILSGGISAFSVGLASKWRIPGLNKGRGSFEAVSNQIYTKFRRQMIKQIAIKTFWKMVAVEAYGGVYGFFIENVYSLLGAKNYVLSLI